MIDAEGKADPFLAPKGTRDEFFLKLEKRIEKPEYTIHFMVDREDRKAMFYNIKGGLDGFDEGDCILLKATVARHDARNGKAQTYLNRCVFIKNYGSKDKKPEKNIPSHQEQLLQVFTAEKESENKKPTWQEQLVQEPPWA